MKYKFDYWTCGDTLIEGREVEAVSVDEAVLILAENEQAPLGQVKNVVVVEQE